MNCLKNNIRFNNFRKIKTNLKKRKNKALNKITDTQKRKIKK